MLTPAKIQAISDPIEEVYIHIVDELLVNIGKHLTSPTWTHTAAWEIQKLSEMGQLTQENAEIINKWIKQLPKEVRDAMEETRRLALEKIEKDMEKAVRLGKLPEPLADSTVNVLNEYSQQAIDQLNLVNTVMLQSSVQQYQRGVQLTKEEYDKLMQQQEQTQIILNEAAGSVATGIETREKALRRAITRISDEGLTGFIDRAGHHWSPEAYVNMDIRTTVHNTAIQSVKNFMTDYNTQVFQVSSHAAARPGCYPYQGKFYSWDNSAGEIELGNGNMVRYEPLNVTTYGQPAGLFGINCGHYPIPIVPGVTIPHGADNIQPKEENDKAYEESQVQRSLERQIREAKRVVEMAGDKASPEMKQKVKDAQEQMRDFIARTGRTRRYDREKIGGLPRGSGTQTASGGKVNTELTKPKDLTVKVKDSEISDIAKANGVQYNPVKRQAKALTEDEIISALAGGDKTGGSCASVGLCYVGQKQGLDVLDFRGGISLDVFCKRSTLTKLKNIPGIKFEEQTGQYAITVGNQLLKRVEKGKEYWFAAGGHAAIVRRNDDDKLQYLELQSETRSGWTDFNGNPRYTLSNRFGCRSSKTWYQTSAFMFEVDSLKDSPEFAMILGYINTAKDEQRKGQGGTIK